MIIIIIIFTSIIISISIIIENDALEDELTGSPWQSHDTVGGVEVVGHWDMDDAYTDDDTDDDHDDDTDDEEVIWLCWWYWRW